VAFAPGVAVPGGVAAAAGVGAGAGAGFVGADAHVVDADQVHQVLDMTREVV